MYETLLDAAAYPKWVVGAKNSVVSTRSWPRRGSRFYPKVGAGPVEMVDNTRLVEKQENRLVVLCVQLRPVATGVVRLALKSKARGRKTRVVMTEEATSGPLAWFKNPLTTATIVARNALSLRRLRRLVDRGVPDAVVIGSGPNGLVAANLLADRGWDVVVLEAGPHYGGAVASAELIEPGFVNDVFSAFYPLAAASPVIAKLHLEEYGLHVEARAARARAPCTRRYVPGACRRTSTKPPRRSTRCISATATAWRALFERWQKMRSGLLDGLFTPIPPIKATGKLLASTIPDGPLRFARFALLSARRMGVEEFTSEGARRLLAGSALHADLSPEDAIGGFFGYILNSLGQDVGWPVPEGGAGRLADALADRLRGEGRTHRVQCARRQGARARRSCGRGALAAARMSAPRRRSSPTSTRRSCSCAWSVSNT